jgi:hypothetical protein
MLYPAELWARLNSIFPGHRVGKIPFPEVCPLCPHPTFRAMGGHSIYFEKYVNRIHLFGRRSSGRRQSGKRKNGGESGIRTRGTPLRGVQSLSRRSLSATQPSLRDHFHDHHSGGPCGSRIRINNLPAQYHATYFLGIFFDTPKNTPKIKRYCFFIVLFGAEVTITHDKMQAIIKPYTRLLKTHTGRI